MVDENKVKLMTKLAIYEKHENYGNLVMCKYYKNDYVRYNVLKTLVASTLVFWMVAGGYIFMNFESILSKLNDMDYFSAIYKILGMYVLFCLVYFVIATVIYGVRYEKAKPGLAKYNGNLKELIELEGGPMHHARVITNSDIVPKQPARPAALVQQKKVVVSRSELVKKKLAEEEKLKEQQIIENVKLRNERLARQNEEVLQQQNELENDRQRILERRKELERMQREKARQESLQRMQSVQYQGYNNQEGRNK